MSNERSGDRVRRGVMFVISSPSGAGKTTLCRRLITEVPGVQLSISAAQRAGAAGRGERDGLSFPLRRAVPGHDRPGRVPGVGQGLSRISTATPRSEVETRLVSGIDVVFDVDWQGARRGTLKTIRPGDVCSVFILPPSIAQLKQGLEGAHPGSDQKSVQSRLAGAGQDILRWGEYDYAIINDNLDTAFAELRAILMTERIRRTRASMGIMVDQLLKDVGPRRRR